MSAVLKPELVFRPMLEADLRVVHAIEQRAYDFPWTRNIFRDCLRSGYHCVIAETGASAAMGYSIMSVAVGEAHVLNLCIAPEHQGAGAGAALLGHMMDQAVRLGAKTAFLEVRQSNWPARRLYMRMGFNEIGERRAYYPARRGREDAVVLGKYLACPDDDVQG